MTTGNATTAPVAPADSKSTNNGGGPVRRRTQRSTSSKNNSTSESVDSLGRKKYRPKTPRTPSSWDPHDDILLRHLKEGLKMGWKDIASHFVNRTPNACQFRWRRLMSGTLRGSNHNTSGLSTPSLVTSSGYTDTGSVWGGESASDGSPPAGPMVTLPNSNSSKEWSFEEDELVMRRDLRFEELSVLLPQRSEPEIWARITCLGSRMNGNSGGGELDQSHQGESAPTPAVAPQHPSPRCSLLCDKDQSPLMSFQDQLMPIKQQLPSISSCLGSAMNLQTPLLPPPILSRPKRQQQQQQQQQQSRDV